ncbi:MAG: pyridoxamine 5'-phosphate oxidase family protein [Oscillospiraceae bacterium]|nr:pyridoxamine 5'-phosphate oxidase family protein [Oscillospiraceae bacterium]
MRRKDREITRVDEKLEIIDKCDVCRLAFADETEPYIVPLNFGYEFSEGKLVLYFHCASKGRKLDIMKKHPRVCFEMDCSRKLMGSGEIACEYTMAYESVIGTGTLELCESTEEKLKGLRLLMRQMVKSDNFTFLSEQIERITVLRLLADDFSAKKSTGIRV